MGGSGLAAGRVGREAVGRAVERVLKGSLEAFNSACMGCGLCNSVCPVYRATGDPLFTPLARVRAAERVLRGERGGAVVRSLFSCLLCGACSTACPYGLDVYRIVFLARSLLAMEGRAPRELVEMAHAAEKTLHSFGLPPGEALRWVREAGLEGRVDRRGAEVLYVPSPVETAFLPRHTIETGRLLDAVGVDWTVSSSVLDCGGNVAVDASRPDVGLRILLNLLEKAEELGVDIVALGACGSDYKWVSLAGELLEELGVETPRARLASIYWLLASREKNVGRLLGKDSTSVVVHDPCSMTRYFRVDTYYRRLVGKAKLPRRSGPYTLCCGGSGGMSIRRDSEARRILYSIAGERLRELARHGKTIVTPCIKCYISFRMAAIRGKLLGKVRLVGFSSYLLEKLSKAGRG